jgi:Ricin-type beta-trefoil lectin domain
MTRRELTWGAAALVVGIVAGALLFRRRDVPPTPTNVLTETPDAFAPDAAMDAGDDVAAEDAGADVEADVDSAPPAPKAPETPRRHHDAALDAPARSPPVVIRESNLRIRPIANENMCVDAPAHAHALQLFPCHGKKNQRWTFAEDFNATSRISDEDGKCVRVGAPNGDGEPRLEATPCGADVARFRLTGDHKLEEARSGQCMTVRRFEKHADIVLEPCNPANTGQAWSLTR